MKVNDEPRGQPCSLVITPLPMKKMKHVSEGRPGNFSIRGDELFVSAALRAAVTLLA